MAPTLSGISSMATRLVLGELCTAYQARTGQAASFESVGGVDAARRVAAGEAFDAVVLASDALDRLAATGHVRPQTRVDLAVSAVALAVPAGTPLPDISTGSALRALLRSGGRIGYSTGPSGSQLLLLFDRWGLREMLEPRLVLAAPGVPVGRLVARGDADLGFQQLSELMHEPGLTVVGPLPADVAITTTFSAAVCTAAPQPDAARLFLQYLASAEAAPAKQRQGMSPA
ncbi:MAG: substrate-binding domain-containing protein [Aquabacterium sp.]